MYSPVDLSCYWDLWTPNDPPGRDPRLIGQITQKVNVGVNILAYATGREPPDKLDAKDRVAETGARDEIERGLLQVAKLRHEGEWDAAPPRPPQPAARVEHDGRRGGEHEGGVAGPVRREHVPLPGAVHARPRGLFAG